MPSMKLALVQINPSLGNVAWNQKKILNKVLEAKEQGADLAIFPELALSGYPPLDLLYQNSFLKELKKAVQSLHRHIPPGLTALVGCPFPDKKPFNSVLKIQKNQKLQVFAKEALPDYSVFEEHRYFPPGSKSLNHFHFHNTEIQILVCEDLWTLKSGQLPGLTKKSGAAHRLIVSVHASPFHTRKDGLRKQLAREVAQTHKCPVVYVNQVGGQEELIFDGGSFVMDPTGEPVTESPFFKEDMSFYEYPLKKPQALKRKGLSASPSPGGREKKRPKKTSPLQLLLQALVFGLREFASSNGFQKAHLCLSGGVDSTVVAYLAHQALGKNHLRLLFLPGPFTSPLSHQMARQVAERLSCPLWVQSIEPFYRLLLKNPFEKSLQDLTRQNLQARVRGMFLMAYANQHRDSLPLGTSNKSELALGYATLYGDMTGALLPLGDVFKTQVYELAKGFNKPPIPKKILTRPPSAELKPRQTDLQDLPPYPLLDASLKNLTEERKSPSTPFEKKIWRQILKSEFKRRQAPPVLKVKEVSFDRGWKVPFVSPSPKTTKKKPVIKRG